MNMNKKKVLSLSIVVIMIAILSFSSLAWFSDADEITNQFMIADSESDADDIFSVDIWEMLMAASRIRTATSTRTSCPAVVTRRSPMSRTPALTISSSVSTSL